VPQSARNATNQPVVRLRALGLIALLAPLAQGIAVTAVVTAISGSASLHATTVRHLTLPDLVSRADRVVRGIVIARDDTTVSAGGGALPATRYQIRVSETLKGQAASGDVIEVRLLAAPKAVSANGVRRGPVFQDLPQFTVGAEYLLALTRPSAVGLSTTVGLRQGLFELRGRGTEEMAVNGANNLGLRDAPAIAAQTRGAGSPRTLPRTRGPMPYAQLANEIRALVRK
jgi:hypothetical protein